MLPFRAPALPPVTGRGLVMPPRSPAPGSPAPLVLAFARYLTGSLERFVAVGGELPPDLQDAHRLVAAALVRAHSRNQKATLACFATPGVGTPLQCMALKSALPDFAERIDGGARSMLSHLLLEMAIRGLLDESEGIEIPFAASSLSDASDARDASENRELFTPSLGLSLRPPAATSSLRFQSGVIRALHNGTVLGTLPLDSDPRLAVESGFAVTAVYRRVGRVTRLALVDHNPIASFEAHPDKHGNHVDLGGRTADEWALMLDDAFALVETHCPELFGEMAFLLHELVPVGHHSERHLSASYREAIGTVYLTLHGNVMTMAEALIHEFQHNKINVASYSAHFLINAFHPLFPSPVRPDPRPLFGILLAVHAFLPVAVLYRRMRAAGHPRSRLPDFERRLSEIDLKNHEGMEMLRAHAEWTAPGRALMNELDAIERAHMSERAAQGMSTKPTDVHLA